MPSINIAKRGGRLLGRMGDERYISIGIIPASVARPARVNINYLNEQLLASARRRGFSPPYGSPMPATITADDFEDLGSISIRFLDPDMHELWEKMLDIIEDDPPPYLVTPGAAAARSRREAKELGLLLHFRELYQEEVQKGL